MTTTSLTFRDLELMVAVHREGSLQAAAERLRLTPSALSHRLSELQARLGVDITQRRGPLELTHTAARLVPRAETLLAELARMTESLAHQASIRRLGISSLLLDGPVLQALVDVMGAGHTAQWELLTGHSQDIEDWVEQGRVDAGLVRLERLRPGLRYDVVAHDRLMPVAATAYCPEGSVTQWPWVLFSSRMGHGQAVNQALRDAGLGLEAAIQVDSFTMALALVERGWVSVLPESAVSRHVADGVLREIPVPDVLWPPRRSVLVTRHAAPAWSGTLMRTIRRRLGTKPDAAGSLPPRD